MRSPFPALSALLLAASLTALHAAESGAVDPAPPEKTLPLAGDVFLIAERTAFLIPPKDVPTETSRPWVWYAPTLPNLPGKAELWMFERFREAGIAIAGIDVGESYGSPAGSRLFTTFYEEMTESRGYSRRPVLLGRSRGGLMTLSWAAENPDRVAAFAGVYPVCNLASYPGVERAAAAFGMKPEELRAQLTRHNPIDRLAALAKARVPLFAVHGDEDRVVPLDANSGLMKQRYTALGGTMRLIVPRGQGHNMWPGFFSSQELVDFVKTHAGGARSLGSSLDSRGDAPDRDPAPASLDSLRWLAGSWSGLQREVETEEHWIEPKGGLMLGVNRSVKGPGKTSFEFLRIAATDKGIVYYASPGGRGPTPFGLASLAENKVTFENAENEFPQRIIYEREDDRLRVRIEGTINGKERSLEWLWQRRG